MTMREIIFRGKRCDNGEWVEGYYFCMVHQTIGTHIELIGGEQE